jgi:hypothetical protein
VGFGSRASFPVPVRRLMARRPCNAVMMRLMGQAVSPSEPIRAGCPKSIQTVAPATPTRALLEGAIAGRSSRSRRPSRWQRCSHRPTPWRCRRLLAELPCRRGSCTFWRRVTPERCVRLNRHEICHSKVPSKFRFAISVVLDKIRHSQGI